MGRGVGEGEGIGMGEAENCRHTGLWSGRYRQGRICALHTLKESPKSEVASSHNDGDFYVTQSTHHVVENLLIRSERNIGARDHAHQVGLVA